MEHPTAFSPAEFAQYNPEKMRKSTLFESDRLLVGLNAFEPGQEHKLHAHKGMDKVYQVIEGRGLFLLEGRQVEVEEGMMLIAPAGVPHGVRNDSESRLLVLAVLSPAPGK